MKLLFFIFVLTLVSCASNRTIVGPDGTPHELVRCVNIEVCFKEAREVCGGNYKIVNTSNNIGGAQMNTPTDINLLVKCEDPK